MTTINSIQDLIQLLRDQPEWAEELRGILLSTELRDLPAAVRELAQSLATTTGETNGRLTNIQEDLSSIKGALALVKEDLSTAKEDITAIKTDVSVLKTDVSVLKTDVSVLKTDVSVLKTDVSVLKTDVSVLKGNADRIRGAEYERYVEDKALQRTYTSLNFTEARTVKGPRTGFHAALSSALGRARREAVQQAMPLPELNEQNSFVNSDIIIADMGDPLIRERRAPPVAYALFEASITADSNDIQRALVRAQTMAATLQVTVTPAVIAAIVPEAQIQEAAEAGVALFLIPE